MNFLTVFTLLVSHNKLQVVTTLSYMVVNQ